MKLRHKIFIRIALVWSLFLVLVFFEIKYAPFFPLLFILFTAVLCFGLMWWLLNRLVIKRIEWLNDDLTQVIAKKEPMRRVYVGGNDELSSAVSQINQMADSLEVSNDLLDRRIKDLTKDLQKENTLLQQEIIEYKSAEKALIMHKEYLARLVHYDNLTTLPNRIFFNEMLNKALNHAHRHNKMFAVLTTDLDRFKQVNDEMGHHIGDLILKEIANRFSLVLRAGDILARLGGDEFIILLNDIKHPKYISLVAEKLLQTCAEPIRIKNKEYSITTSIGICVYPNDGLTLESLEKNVDISMYKAKRAGGNVFQYYTQEMNFEGYEHMQIENALRKAICDKEFVLYYQPKLNLEDGSISGVEALIRWEHPELGLVNPGSFIPFAEESGLIMQIGEWALHEACRVNKSWQDQGYQPISMAVNLSPVQFHHQDIAMMVTQALETSGLDPKYLELEITETTMMKDIDAAVIKLNLIKDMGVNIAIDDFGTGYTSISYLKRFPISVLKIDQMFIKGVPQNQDDLAITTAVIALAHSMGLKVVAEGVESVDQLKFLADHDCDIVQGYYLSRPLPEQKVILQFTKTISDSN